MRRSSNIALVPVYGDLTSRTVPAVRGVINSLVEHGTQRIVLNMADVMAIDSSGMALILGAIRQMRDCGGLLSLINVEPHVLKRLRIARVVDLVPVSPADGRKDVPELSPSALPMWSTTLPVKGCNLQAARRRVAELAERLPFSSDEVFDLTLAVGEALGNACDHTSGKGILATVSAYSDRIVVEVVDRGEGFDATEATESSNIERGRGISLMELLVDSVRISRRPGGNGTIVRLEKLIA